jgi:hypothetical protein
VHEHVGHPQVAAAVDGDRGLVGVAEVVAGRDLEGVGDVRPGAVVTPRPQGAVLREGPEGAVLDPVEGAWRSGVGLPGPGLAVAVGELIVAFEPELALRVDVDEPRRDPSTARVSRRIC